MASRKKKKLIGAGVALALIASVTAGGAFVTQVATIENNKFKVNPHDPGGGWEDSGIVVTGSPMSYAFSGQVKDEEVTQTYTLTNKSARNTYHINIGSVVQEKEGVLQDVLAKELAVFATVGNSTSEDIGTLANMKLNNVIEIKPGDSEILRLKVAVRDEEEFHKAGLHNGANALVDFQFSHMKDEE